MKKVSKNVKLVLDILRDEVNGDIVSSLQKLSDEYSMTWMYKGKNILFPKTKNKIKDELEEVYHIKGRVYDIVNIAESKDLVMIELIESYPYPKAKKKYRTPMVLVLELVNGKIKTGRHYTDPRLSFMNLTTSKIKKVIKKDRFLLSIK